MVFGFEEKYEIQIPAGVFEAGETVCGKALVKIAASKAKRMFRLSVRWTASEFCYFSNSVFLSENDMRDARNRNEIIFMDLETTLWERPETESGGVAPSWAGKANTWRFTAPIPQTAPAAFEHKNGFIRYTLILQIDFMPGNPIRKQVTVPVVSSFESLRRIAPTATENRSEVPISSCCFNYGDIASSLSLPDHTGPLVFASGTTLQVKASIDNKSRVAVRASRIELLRITHVRCVPPEKQLDQTIRSRADIIAVTRPTQGWFSPDGGRVGANGVLTGSAKVTIPDTEMTINGRLNRVDYALRLYVEPDSGRAINKLTLPLCVSYGYPPDESKPHQHTKASKQPHHTELPMDPNMGLAALVQGSWSNANKNQNQNQNQTRSAAAAALMQSDIMTTPAMVWEYEHMAGLNV